MCVWGGGGVREGLPQVLSIFKVNEGIQRIFLNKQIKIYSPSIKNNILRLPSVFAN